MVGKNSGNKMYHPTDLGKKVIIRLGERLEEEKSSSIWKGCFVHEEQLAPASYADIDKELADLETEGIIRVEKDAPEQFLYLTNYGWQMWNFLVKS